MSVWSQLTEMKRASLLRRRFLNDEDVGVLAQEVGMKSTTLNRRLQELRASHPELLETPSTLPSASRTLAFAPVSLRSAVFDIETMDFGTGGIQSHLVCAVILPLDTGKPITLKMEFSDHRDDRRLLGQVIKELSEFDILIGHNLTAFDMNWLYSRNAYFGGGPLPTWLLYDTYQAARRMALKVESKGLGALGAYFGVKEGMKTRVFRTDWSFIDSPIEEEFDQAMMDIVQHCVNDVIRNRRVFDALWRYDTRRSFTKTKW